MTQRVSEDLVTFLRDRAGDYLRSVVYYDRDSFELLYLRDDVEDEYTGGEIERVVDDLRLESFGAAQQEDLYVHGALGCTVRCFEEGVELHFPHEDFTGTAVALEPGAIADLHSFVGDCLERIPEEHRRI